MGWREAYGYAKRFGYDAGLPPESERALNSGWLRGLDFKQAEIQYDRHEFWDGKRRWYRRLALGASSVDGDQEKLTRADPLC